MLRDPKLIEPSLHGEPATDGGTSTPQVPPCRHQQPYLWVDDPEDGAIEPSPEDRANVARGIRLGHYATTAEGLGLPAATAAIRRAKDEQSGGLDLPRPNKSRSPATVPSRNGPSRRW